MRHYEAKQFAKDMIKAVLVFGFGSFILILFGYELVTWIQSL